MTGASDNKTLFSVAEKVLVATGAQANQACLDFGCGHGNYTIPLAHLVGPAGKVYALDKDEQALEQLGERARAVGLANIETVVWSGESRFPFGNDSLDLVLLYDVLHGHYFSADERASLFREVGRVSKPGALLSVFPRHMADDEVAREIVGRAARAGFEAAGEYEGPVVHDDAVTRGRTVTFRKAGGRSPPPSIGPVPSGSCVGPWLSAPLCYDRRRRQVSTPRNRRAFWV